MKRFYAFLVGLSLVLSVTAFDRALAQFEGWIREPGAGKDIGVGGGTVWVIGTDEVPGGYGIYQWDGAAWERFPGAGTAIAVDEDGLPWVVNSDGNIFRMGRDHAWQQLPGRARDIGIAPGRGGVWVIGTDEVPGGYGIYQWNGSGWNRIDGAGVRIAVGGDGEPWVVNSDGNIFRRTNGKWQQYPGGARDIGVAQEPETHEDLVWVIGTDDAGDGGGIYHLVVHFTPEWKRVDGAGWRISVDRDGIVWIVNRSGSIFRSRTPLF